MSRSALRALPAPGVDDRVIFGAPSISEDEIEEVIDTLRSGWIGTGPKTRLFEREFANYVSKDHAVATNSGTAALHLALNALGVGPGDEVITTPLTFVATANVIEHCGATPVFADVCPNDGNVDPAEIDAKVTSRTKVILPVHYAGAPADVQTMRDRHPSMPIVVDAAHAVEARYNDGTASAGGGATCSAYSFYVTKNLSTGEGGMLVTDDGDLASTVRIRSLHGLDNDAWNRYTSGDYGSYELDYPGFKYNMTDLQASLGIHQLSRLERSSERRQEIWARYNAAFAGVFGVEPPPVALASPEVGRHARHLYTLWVDWTTLGIDRRTFVQEMAALGIGTGWHFRTVHLHGYYRARYGYKEGDFPVAEAIADATISLPLSTALSDHDVERVIEVVDVVLGRLSS